jgi:hypothetical protein
MSTQQHEKLQKLHTDIAVLKASIETVTDKISRFKKLASAPQLYTWRKYRTGLKGKLAEKKRELTSLNIPIQSINHNLNTHV